MVSADLRETRFLYVMEFSDVTLVRDGKVILKDISWRVKDGEHWAVVGNSGSGKTSMLRIITGYLWPTNGKEVLGNSFGSVDLRKLRKNIGWIS
ncbi:ATP-binding cassette domain-containing protein [Candidatus Bathyarchaeota archaeon]|nr:ATP-binding cassette domain-containing protein [Candidatus Bathyarchaeota archaeon]